MPTPCFFVDYQLRRGATSMAPGRSPNGFALASLDGQPEKLPWRTRRCQQVSIGHDLSPALQAYPSPPPLRISSWQAVYGRAALAPMSIETH